MFLDFVDSFEGVNGKTYYDYLYEFYSMDNTMDYDTEYFYFRKLVSRLRKAMIELGDSNISNVTRRVKGLHHLVNHLHIKLNYFGYTVYSLKMEIYADLFKKALKTEPEISMSQFLKNYGWGSDTSILTSAIHVYGINYTSPHHAFGTTKIAYGTITKRIRGGILRPADVLKDINKYDKRRYITSNRYESFSTVKKSLNLYCLEWLEFHKMILNPTYLPFFVAGYTTAGLVEREEFVAKFGEDAIREYLIINHFFQTYWNNRASLFQVGILAYMDRVGVKEVKSESNLAKLRSYIKDNLEWNVTKALKETGYYDVKSFRALLLGNGSSIQEFVGSLKYEVLSEASDRVGLDAVALKGETGIGLTDVRKFIAEFIKEANRRNKYTMTISDEVLKVWIDNDYNFRRVEQNWSYPQVNMANYFKKNLSWTIKASDEINGRLDKVALDVVMLGVSPELKGLSPFDRNYLERSINKFKEIVPKEYRKEG